jgi:hypothetical protein
MTATATSNLMTFSQFCENNGINISESKSLAHIDPNMTMRDLWQHQDPAHQNAYAIVVGQQLADRRRALLHAGVQEEIERGEGEAWVQGEKNAVRRADGTIKRGKWTVERGWVYTFIEKYKP